MKAKRWALAFLAALMIIAALPLTVMAAKVRMSPTVITLEKGEVYKLKVLGTGKKAEWSSSREKVATVNQKGYVRARKAGRTTIRAKVGGKTLTCSVKVVNITGVWVVQAGIFNSQYNLARQFIRVKDLVDDAAWKYTDGAYRISAGKFYDRENAIARRNYLQYYGIDATIVYQ